MCTSISCRVTIRKRDMPISMVFRDAPITHWPIIGRLIIGAKQSADYRPSADYQLIQKVPETGQKPAVHTV